MEAKLITNRTADISASAIWNTVIKHCACLCACVCVNGDEALCWAPASGGNYRLFVRIMLLADWRSVKQCRVGFLGVLGEWEGDCERCVFAQLCQKKHVTHCLLWISVHLAVNCFLTHTPDIIIPVKVTWEKWFLIPFCCEDSLAPLTGSKGNCFLICTAKLPVMAMLIKLFTRL